MSKWTMIVVDEDVSMSLWIMTFAKEDIGSFPFLGRKSGIWR